MSLQKALSYYFKCLSDAGEVMSFDLVKIQKDQAIHETFNHLQYDGASAITKHLKINYPGQKVDYPNLKFYPAPSFLKRMILLLKWNLSVGFQSFYVPQGTDQDAKASFDTRTLLIKDQKDLNAKILLALHLALKTQETSLWMLPVSLHEKLGADMELENKASFIDVKVQTNENVEDLRAKISHELKSKSYWGTIYTMYLPLLMGQKLFALAYPYFSLFLKRTGTFTNLGQWKIEGIKEAWAIKATVASLNPMGASALQINDQLALGLQLHPSLKMTNAQLKEILDNWKINLETIL